MPEDGFVARPFPAPEIVGSDLATGRVCRGFGSNVHVRVSELDDPRLIKGLPNVLLTRLPFVEVPAVDGHASYHPFADYARVMASFDEVWVTSEGEQAALSALHPSVQLLPALSLGCETAALGEPSRHRGQVMELVSAASHLSDVLTSPLVYYGRDVAGAAREMSGNAEVFPLTMLDAVEGGRCDPGRIFFCSLDTAGAVALLAPLCDAFCDLAQRYPEALLLVHLPHAEQSPGAFLRLLLRSAEFYQLNLSLLQSANIRVITCGHPDQVARRLFPCAAFQIESPLAQFGAHLAGVAVASGCLPITAHAHPDRCRPRVAPRAWQRPGWTRAAQWPGLDARDVLAVLQSAVDLSGERHAALVAGTRRSVASVGMRRWLGSRLSNFRSAVAQPLTEHDSA
jgi:hypothetical protein